MTGELLVLGDWTLPVSNSNDLIDIGDEASVGEATDAASGLEP